MQWISAGIDDDINVRIRHSGEQQDQDVANRLDRIRERLDAIEAKLSTGEQERQGLQDLASPRG